MTTTPPTPYEIRSIEESDIDFSSAGFNRYRFIDKTYKAYMRAKPKADEVEIYRWIHLMIRKLDSGVPERDLPPIQKSQKDPKLEEVARDMERGRVMRIKEAIDLLTPYIRYIKLCNPDRGRELEGLFVSKSVEVNIHPATVLLDWIDSLKAETEEYIRLATEYHESSGVV